MSNVISSTVYDIDLPDSEKMLWPLVSTLQPPTESEPRASGRRGDDSE